VLRIVIVDQKEAFAFLKQRKRAEDQRMTVPRRDRSHIDNRLAVTPTAAATTHRICPFVRRKPIPHLRRFTCRAPDFSQLPNSPGQILGRTTGKIPLRIAAFFARGQTAAIPHGVGCWGGTSVDRPEAQARRLTQIKAA
jgi:hypothetical protein